MFQYEQFEDGDKVSGTEENQARNHSDLSIRNKIKLIMHSKPIHVSSVQFKFGIDISLVC